MLDDSGHDDGLVPDRKISSCGACSFECRARSKLPLCCTPSRWCWIFEDSQTHRTKAESGLSEEEVVEVAMNHAVV